jgi:phosphate:Na+ symporter
LTVNFAVAIITGIIMTTLIQSSSAVIIIIISLINLELLDFEQAIGVIIGANIGTTATIQLISFNLDNYLGLFILSAVVLYIIYNLTRLALAKYLAQGLVSYSCLLFGLNILSNSLLVVKDKPFFSTVLNFLDEFPLLGLFLGLVVTAIVQSSSAVNALVVALASGGLVRLELAISIALGSNIGTCVTAFLAAIGSNRQAKLAAWAHLYFNIVGVVIILPLLPYFIYVIQYFDSDLSRQIANAHTSFNLLTALVVFIGRNQFITLVHKSTKYIKGAGK